MSQAQPGYLFSYLKLISSVWEVGQPKDLPCSSYASILVVNGEITISKPFRYPDAAVYATVAGSDDNDLDWSEILDFSIVEPPSILSLCGIRQSVGRVKTSWRIVVV